jgi:hypothetical protein
MVGGSVSSYMDESTPEPWQTRNDHGRAGRKQAHWPGQPYATTVFGINAHVGVITGEDGTPRGSGARD